MDEDEDHKTKKNGLNNNESLPNINKGKNTSDHFQLEDFNSKESDNEGKDELKMASPLTVDPVVKFHAKKLSNTSDKMQQMEEINSHKNGTVTGSDHKPFQKSTPDKTHTKTFDAPLDNSRVGVKDEKQDNKKSENSEAANEILFKDRKK